MWVYSHVKVKLMKVILFYRSGIYLCCEIVLYTIGLDMKTSVIV